MTIKEAIAKVVDGCDLASPEAAAVMDTIMEGGLHRRKSAVF